jgi:hypothetical protein
VTVRNKLADLLEETARSRRASSRASAVIGRALKHVAEVGVGAREEEGVDRGVFSSSRRPTHRYSLLGFPMYSDFIVPFSR